MMPMTRNLVYNTILNKINKMKIYTKPTIEVIVTSQEVLDLGASDSVGDDNEFTNMTSFEEDVIGNSSKDDLWDED